MEIIFLGTSAALPTLNRFGTAIAINLGGETLLFDCGEGAQIQFQKANLKPGKLSRIFITHFHGDHFYGLIGLLTSLQLNGREKPLHLYGPVGLNYYLDVMQKLSHFEFNYDVNIHEVEETSESQRWKMPGYSVTALPLEHRVFVLGFRIEENPKPGKFDTDKADRLGIPEGPERSRLQNGESITLADGKEIRPDEVLGPPQPGRKVAICLDTKPCTNAERLAQNADVLIFDATFDDSKTDLAETTGHATVTQAAELAQRAEVGQLILTHISQRYSKTEDTLLKQARAVFPNTRLAFDLMRMEI